MTTEHDTTEQSGRAQEGHIMNGETLYEEARSGRRGLEAIRRAEAGQEGDDTPAMLRTIGDVTYILDTGGMLWITEANPGEGAPYQEPVKIPPQGVARLFRFFLPIALEQLLDWGKLIQGKEVDQAREAEQAE